MIVKYNLEIARKKVADFGYILDEDVYINNVTRMKCHDNDGYKYLLDLSSIKVNSHPKKFDISNPFTIYNIQHLLDIETDGTKIAETNYTGSKTKMKFICSCGEEFYMTVNSLVTDNKRYCNFCSRSKPYDGLIDYTKLIQEECDKRGYELITKDITRSRQKFDYICTKHRDKGMLQSTYNLLVKRGHGCAYCGSETSGLKRRIDINEAIELVNSKGLKYVDYYYDKPNENATSQLFIKYICNNHVDRGIQVAPYQEMKNRGFGCPCCKISRNERIVSEILDKNGIKYKNQYTFEDCKDKYKLPFDFYLLDKNTLIEVDGEGHYFVVNFGGTYEDAIKKFETCKKHDKMKDEYCDRNNIKLVRIPYYIIKDENIDLEKYILDRI